MLKVQFFQARLLKNSPQLFLLIPFLINMIPYASLSAILIITGFGLLTAALLFGFFTIDNFFAQHLAHKTAFSIISWFLYGALLIGHYKFGWRGRKAIRFTITGFILLAIGFIGSKFVLEMILGR